MAKLTLLLATFALFLLAANASIYRATVVIDSENPSQERSCQEQIQQQQQLRACQMLLRQQVRGEGEEEWGGRSDNQQETQVLRQCCQQLQQLDTKCRCQGLQETLRRQQQQGQIKGDRQLQKAYDTASEIPRMCNISPRQGCQFGTPHVF